MKSFHSLLLAWFAALYSSAAVPSTLTLGSEHVVLKNNADALLIARAYYPVIVHDHITAEEAQKLASHLPALVEKYVSPRLLSRSVNHDMKDVPDMLRNGKYRIQMMPLQTGGRRVVLINLLHVDFARDDAWRTHLYGISDGGIYQCRCIIDLAREEILKMDCNGYG